MAHYHSVLTSSVCGLCHYQVYLESIQSPFTKAFISISWITWYSFTRKLCCHCWEQLKLSIFISCHPGLLLSPHNTSHCQHAHHFSAACDDKINNCNFKFSMAYEWCFNLRRQVLQLAKVFPAIFLRLPICQSFPCHCFALYGMFMT